MKESLQDFILPKAKIFTLRYDDMIDEFDTEDFSCFLELASDCYISTAGSGYARWMIMD